MENTTEALGKGLKYDHTLFGHKHFFAGYLNLCQSNIETVFKTVYRFRFSIQKDALHEIFNKKQLLEISEADYIDRVEFLKQYFPVIGYLDLPISNKLFENFHDKISARREYFIDNFKMLLKAINDLRNFYTHYYHAPLNLPKELYSLIDQIFLDVTFDLKKAKKKKDHTEQFLKDSLKEEIALLYEKKRNDLKEKQKRNRKIKLDDETINNTVFNDAFSHLIYKSVDSQSNQLRDYNKSLYSKEESAENGITISQNGLLFLLSMFLSKKESSDIRGRIKGFKATVIKDDPNFPNDRNNSLKFMVTHWVYSYLNVKPIKQKLNSEFSKETLLIQIVDELTKVPNEVYQNLSEDLQQSFVEDINEYIKEGNVDETLDSARVVHPVIRKRYDDKFNYFVLRYLDEFANFPSLRFQIHLGNYIHDSQTKEIAGTTYKSERLIKEKIHVFGKLSEVGNLKTDYILQNNILNEALGWEIYPNPSYNTIEGNVPIFINLLNSPIEGAKKLFGQISKARSLEKTEIRKSTKASKEQITNLIDNKIIGDKFDKIYIGPPTALLSLNELPALLYELLKNNKTPQELENILVEKLMERFKVIENYVPGTLPNSQIPKKLNRSSTTKRINVDKLVKVINDEINIGKTKLDLIKTNEYEFRDRNSKRKYIFYTKELGAEATWIANDLKRFMPLESRKKWKGYMHTQLQNSLAYYDQKPNEAFKLLESVWDFDDQNFSWNQGIKKTFKNKGFENFYKSYLQNRNEELNSIIEKISSYSGPAKLLSKLIKQQHIDNLFYMRLYLIDATPDQISKLLAKPLVFPRGIFDSKPTYIKNKKITENPELFANWYTYSYGEHEYQEFYNYEREYRDNYNKLRFEKDVIIKNDKKLSPVDQFTAFKYKEDIKIKVVKLQDLYLKLIAEQLYLNIFGHEIMFSLKGIFKDRQERLAASREAKQQNNRLPGDSSDNLYKDSFIWDSTIVFEDNQIKKTIIKIKDIGKIKRFLQEEKVKSIFSYDANKKWTIGELEDELYIKSISYETIRREHLLHLIHQFEKDILEKFSFDGSYHPEEFEQDSNPNFKYYVANGALKHKISESDISWLLNLGVQDFENLKSDILLTKPEIVQHAFLLVLIRNKFSHNQLPAVHFYRLIESFVSESDKKSISETIFNYTKYAVNLLLQ